ncbi:type VI secretion system tip protein VgrG, partial [Chromobacterium phragmitis]
HDGDAAENREFVVTAQSFQVRNNLPTDLTRQLQQTAPSLLALSPKPHVGEEPGENGSQAAPFATRIQAQRRGIPLTPAYAGTESAKPTSL